MKKILYVIISPAHKRVFESFVEIDGVKQIIIGPTPPNRNGIVPENYDGFKIKDIRYLSGKGDGLSAAIVEQVKKIKPDVYVQADLNPIHNSVRAKLLGHNITYKRVYVSHGMIGSHVVSAIKSIGINTDVWKGIDLYCGATSVFAEWVRRVVKAEDSKILTNALPQLDIIYDSNYYNSYRDLVLNKIKFPNAKKVILFVGFCGKNRSDFKDHNEDYFKTAIALSKKAKDHDWLVMIKPRHTHDEIMKFLQSHKWGNEYIKDYASLQNNKHVHFITAADTHIYRYYFADAFVINGCSTVEVEACAIQKPLFIVRTKVGAGYDPYNTVKMGAGVKILNMLELNNNLTDYFNSGKYHYPEKQKKLIESMGISFDGNMHKRIQKKLLETK